MLHNYDNDILSSEQYKNRQKDLKGDTSNDDYLRQLSVAEQTKQQLKSQLEKIKNDILLIDQKNEDLKGEYVALKLQEKEIKYFGNIDPSRNIQNL